ncbi:sensor histidine kinase [Paenibacillus rubinfantis]|uniref:sensor histidine kinase n=1 Tax=Paenibacillus rubinfantis TaxID=1720296 RepID=UPI00073EEE0A|nr:HAMP domain-containing sensor histidine kinase [Paenibacillus rubinfantis]
MKSLIKGFIVFFVIVIVVLFGFIFKSSSPADSDIIHINHWQIAWTDHLEPQPNTEWLEGLDNWTDVRAGDDIPVMPSTGMSQWIKIQLPELKGNSEVLLIEKIYGKHIVVNINGVSIYETQRKFNYNLNSILVPIRAEESKQTVYIGVSANNKIGIFDEIKIGDYQSLMKDFIRQSISDLILGSTLIFIAVIMLFCSVFLKYVNMSMWFSLCAVIFSSGLLVLTYSPFVFWLFDYTSTGRLLVILFDVALFILLPSFTFFFEKIFGPGYFNLIRWSRKFLVGYSTLCILVLITNEIASNRFYNVYSLITTQFAGYIIIFQFLILICLLSIYMIKGNKEAVIFFVGVLSFTLFCAGELIWYYYNDGYYKLFLWKVGVICFLTSLIIILGRRFAENHEQVVEYSKQLEMFNNELQRSEKMEIISELAASVAHEVRNPLQVTRGFLQLLVEKQQSSDKVYLSMALEELDRASGIITDFLTFAKPEGGKVTTLNVLDEFIHIEGILIPLANLQGGKITVHIPKNLYVRGNSSKFKQAFINIIKNSIEALKGEGDIQIWGYEETTDVVLHIKDNGEGMDEEVLARLGEPYFSNKTKGTGLGLMVTFRIIEVMNGQIHFNSKKGTGTEVIIRFPSVKLEENVTG